MFPKRPVFRKRLIAVLAAAIVVVVVVFYFLILPLVNPLRRSNAAIAASLLAEVSPGTPRDEVKALIQQRGWIGGGIVGAGNIGDVSISLGTYQDVPFRVTVIARWQFDGEGKLQSVRVDKMSIDAP